MDRDLTINSIVYGYRGDDKGTSTRRNVASGLDKPVDVIIGSINDSKGRRTKLEVSKTSVNATTGRVYQTRALIQLIADPESTTAEADAVLDIASYAANMGRNAPDLTAQADIRTKVFIAGEI
jgi:hypothetical protein